MPNQTMNMMANTRGPGRLSFTMCPNMNANANGRTRIAQFSTKLFKGVEFSNGWAEFMLKNPPPFVPSCLIAIWLAAGPPGNELLGRTRRRCGTRS